MLTRHLAYTTRGFAAVILLLCFVRVTYFEVMQAVDALCAKNFMGETTLMQAAGAPKPGAFQVVAKMLTASEVWWFYRIQHNRSTR